VRYAVIGGGPSGLYFALLAKKANPSDEVLVVERNPPDATFGWGVVFSEETLGALRDADYETYTEIGESFARWNAIDIYYHDTMVRSRGHVFTGISRKVLLNILQRRCQALGVRLEFEREVRDVGEFEGADLIVGADGINGLVRRTYGEFFKPQIATHPTKYVWFGSDLPLDAFTFIFRQNDDGLFQVHAYPFDARTCTFIVECPEAAWRNAGLDSASEAESIAYCEALFQPELRGRGLMSNRSLWVNFLTLRQESWHHGNVVLLGDAAHTAHFSIGSGTKLAMEDSIALIDALRRHRELGAALNDYEMERQPIVERFQEAALESSSYFEHVSRYAHFDPRQFAFNLLTRSRRITYINLTQRDPELVRTVDSWFAANATGSPDGAVRLSPPPMFTPFQIGELSIPNRVALAAGPNLEAAARLGAGLVITEFVSVTEDGRILVINVSQGTDPKNRIFCKDLQSKDSKVIELLNKQDAHYEFIGNEGSSFWFLTDLGSPRRRIIAIDALKPDSIATVVPEAADKLENVTLVGDRLPNLSRNGGGVSPLESYELWRVVRHRLLPPITHERGLGVYRILKSGDRFQPFIQERSARGVRSGRFGRPERGAGGRDQDQPPS